MMSMKSAGAGLRPPVKRMALAAPVRQSARHLTAEMLYEEATLRRFRCHSRPVYNTLNQLTDAASWPVSVDGTKTISIPRVQRIIILSRKQTTNWSTSGSHLVLQKMPEVPEGYEIAGSTCGVRLRKRR